MDITVDVSVGIKPIDISSDGNDRWQCPACGEWWYGDVAECPGCGRKVIYGD